jgi:hypothetical protein
MPEDNFQILKSITLPRRPLKNYETSLNDGGDCGACVTAGLLGLSSVEEAYTLHRPGNYYGGSPIPQISSFSRRSMEDTLDCAASDTGARGGLENVPILLDHAVKDTPIWPFGGSRHDLHFGLKAQFEWRGYVRAMLNGGYYGVAQVRHGGWPRDTPLEQFGTTNHWVLICGWRYLFTPETDPERKLIGSCGSYEEQILIGNSSRTRPLESWIDMNDFQRFWGGFDAIWARPLTA